MNCATSMLSTVTLDSPRRVMTKFCCLVLSNFSPQADTP